MRATDVINFALVALAAMWVWSWASVVFLPLWRLLTSERYEPPYAIRDLVKRSTVRGVHFRLRDLPLHHFAYATTPLPGVRLIVVDRRVAEYASTVQLLFIVGHELGHLRMGHVEFGGLVSRVTRAMLYLNLDEWEAQKLTRERAADEYSRLMTGIPRDVMYGIQLPGQGGGST